MLSTVERNISGSWRRWIDWAIPGAASISLLIACLVMSAKKPLWYDEVLTRTLLTDPSVHHMLRAMANGAEAAPPLYHFVARAWIALFGSDPLALRLLSWTGFSVALFLVWRVLRSAFDRRAAAIGLLCVFCGSVTVLTQDVEIRFYGVLTALVAIALVVAARVIVSTKPSTGLLAAMTGINAALVLSHFFGFVYSGAILAALVAWDIRQRRIRLKIYGAVVVGWLAYLPWITSTISQASMASGGNWTPIPQIADLLGAFGFQIPLLDVVILGVLLAALLAEETSVVSEARAVDVTAGEARRSLLYIAFALIGTIPLVFIFSRIAVSLFLERYFLPAGLGFSIILAELVTRVMSRTRTGRGSNPLPGLITSALVVLLLLFPLYRARSAFQTPRPGSEIASLTVDGVPVTRYPIAVEANVTFLPFAYYASPGDAAYFFLTDSVVASDPRAILGSGMEMKAMQVFKRNGYFADRIVDGTEFLCTNERFAVIDDAQHFWFESRVLGDSAFVSRKVSEFGTTHGPRTVQFVERRAGILPRGCSNQLGR
jgi:hypothetical protein